MMAADRIRSIEARAARMAWLRSTAPFTLTALASLVLWVVIAVTTCHPARPTEIPASLAGAVERHAAASVIDSAEIHRLEAFAAAATMEQHAYAATAARLDSAARAEHLRADSLAELASRATSAADSAAQFHAAYSARTAEADSLRVELVAKDTVIVSATRRGDSLALALLVSKSMTTRANAVIAQAVDVVRKSDPPCRLLHVIGCPSRTSVAIGGAVVGALATVAVHQLVHTP